MYVSRLRRVHLLMIRPRTQRLLLVACMVASVMVSDLAGSHAWLAGDHATPQQWALHVMYESFGVHHHHGEVDAHESSTGPLGVVIGGSEPVWTTARPGGAADPGHLTRSLRDIDAGAYASLTTSKRVVIGDSVRTASPNYLVLDPPPKRTAA